MTSRTSISRSVAAVAAVTTSVVLAACSSGGSGAGGKATSNAAAETLSQASAGGGSTPSGQPIKIGTINAEGTSSQNNPDVVAAARAAADQINANGGVKGRPIQIDYCNEGASPNTAADCGRQMQKDGVVATVRDLSVTGGAQLNSVLLAANIPQINLNALTPAELSAKNAFPVDGGTTMEYLGAEKSFKDKGGKKVAILGDDLPFSATLESSVKSGASALGLQFGTYAKVTLTTSDYLPAATTIANSGADGVILQLSGPQINQVLPALKTAGYNGWLLVNGGGMTGKDYAAIPTDQASKFLVFQPFPPISAADSLPPMASLKAAFEARKNQGDKDIDLHPNASSISGYFGVVAVAKVLEGLSQIDSKTLMDALNSGTKLDNGLTPALDYSHPGPIQGFARVPASWGYTVTIKDGELALDNTEPFNSLTLLQR